MKRNLYAVRDNLTMSCELPFSAETDLKALQIILTEINAAFAEFEAKKTFINPSDQLSTRSLYYLGTIEDGYIKPSRIKICDMLDVQTRYDNSILEFQKENN